MENINYFALAIPFFIGGIVIEIIYQCFSKRLLYRFDDFIVNLSCGIGQQVIDVFLKILIIGVYAAVYENFRLYTIHSTIGTQVLLFVLIDLFFYWFHRCAHQINLLWGTHIVHHQSDEFNFSVALRQSWFDNLFNIFFYLPLAILGFDSLSFFIMFSFNTIYQFVIHTKLIGRLGFLEYILNTPSHHRVHHGTNEKYIDKNFGGVFILWDKLFNTFQKEEETVIYGITSPILSFNPITLNFAYWWTLFKDLKKIPAVKKKILYLLSKPGTIPSDEIRFFYSSQINRRKKLISSANSIRSRIYVIWHFLQTVSCFILFLSFELSYRTWEKIAIIGYILAALTILGGIVLVKNNFYAIDFLRILFSIFIWYILIKSMLSENILLLTSIYFITNIMMLIFFTYKRA